MNKAFGIDYFAKICDIIMISQKIYNIKETKIYAI